MSLILSQEAVSWYRSSVQKSKSHNLTHLKSVGVVAVGFDFEVTPARLVDGVGEICWGHETFVLESWRALNQMVLNQVEPLVLFPWQWNQNGVRGFSFG